MNTISVKFLSNFSFILLLFILFFPLVFLIDTQIDKMSTMI